MFGKRFAPKQPKNEPKAPSPQPTHKKPHTSGSPTNTLPPVIEIQGVIGNSGVQRRLQSVPQGQIQRLMTKDELIAKAGAPKEDRFFGLKKMSEGYKKILKDLERYHGFSLNSVRDLDVSDEFLDVIQRDCNSYLQDHPNDERSPHIQAIVNDIPTERNAIQTLRTTPALFQRVRGKSIREALLAARDTNEVNQLVQEMQQQNASPSQNQKQQAKGQYSTYLGQQNVGLTGLIQEQTGVAGTQPFRGSDELTEKGKGFMGVLGKDYVRDTVAPLIANLLGQVSGSNIQEEMTDSAYEAEQDQTVKNNTKRMVRDLYRSLVDGLANTPLPQDIVDAAAQTFARVYTTVSNDPNAQHGALQSAKISVVNMIYLRWINPQLMNFASKLRGHATTRGMLLRLSQILQRQSSGVNVNNMPEFAEEDGTLVAYTKGVIDGVIQNIVQQGQLLAQQQAQQNRRRGVRLQQN